MEDTNLEVLVDAEVVSVVVLLKNVISFADRDPSHTQSTTAGKFGFN
jgi:hypothetical protein